MNRFEGGTVRRSGFTLVETLVVTGIVLILAVIIFTVASNSLTGARGVMCVHRLKTCHAALLSFAYDNNNQFPLANSTNDNWVFQTQPYLEVKNLSITVNRGKSPFFCPEALVVQKPYGSIGNTYAMNSSLSQIRVSMITSPASLILLADGGKVGAQFWLDANPTSKAPSKIHSGNANKANCLFADGHVEALASWDTNISKLPWGMEP